MANEFIARKGLIVSGSARISGSVTASLGFSGNGAGITGVISSSYATNADSANSATSSSFATSASWAPGGSSVSSSYATTALTASYFSGSAWAGGGKATPVSIFNTSASYAITASYALNGGGVGSSLTTKAGNITNTAFVGTPRKAPVAFSTPFVDTNYAVVITGEDARSWTIEGKAVAGFTASANSNTALTGLTYWIATAYGES